MADGDILLKLVMKGVDPSEAQRLASSSTSQLEHELKLSLQRQIDAHKSAQDAFTRDAEKQANEEIASAGRATKEIISAMRLVQAEADKTAAAQAKASADAERAAIKAAEAAQKAAEAEANRWKSNLSVMRDVTLTATGIYGAIVGIASKAIELGEEIDKVTNAFGALKGSIEEARIAGDGEVSNLDLITAKNLALELQLKLTDKQFAAIAAAADSFADIVGGNTKQALDGLIQGLATGRSKTLEHAGVTLDAQRIEADYARTLGMTSDQLSDHAKKVSMAEAALRAMDKKVVEAGVNVRDFSHEWEHTTAILKNAWDEILLSLGRGINEIVFNLSVGIPDAMKIGIAKIKDVLDGAFGSGTEHFEDQARAQFGKDTEDYQGINAAKKRVADAQARLSDPTGSAYKVNIGDMSSPNQKPAGHVDYDLEKNPLFSVGDKNQKAGETLRNMEESSLFGTVSTEDMVKSRDAITADLQKETNDLVKGMTEELDKAVKREEDLNKTNDKAGGGVFARILFGPGGPDKTYEEMDSFQQKTVETVGELSKLGDNMAGAFGKAFASAASGEKSFGAALKDGVRDAIKGLAAQAATHAVMEGAMALASLAIGDVAGASLHGAAAAEFGLVAAASGAALAGLGPSSSSKSSAANTPTSSRSSSPTGSGSTSSTANQQAAPLTINLNVGPGGEAESGRAIMKAIAAYQAQTGRNLGIQN